METNEIRNNTITLVGDINTKPEFSHEVFGEGFYTFDLKTERLSGNADIIPITVSERLVDLNQLEIGLSIIVNGQIRSYNKREETKTRLVLSVFAIELEWNNNQVNDENKVLLEGFICKQPGYRETPLGRQIADLLIAVNRPYGKSDYIPCICWGRNAKFAGGIQIGSKVGVQGRFQSRVYQKKLSETEFEPHVAYELSVSKIELLSCVTE